MVTVDKNNDFLAAGEGTGKLHRGVVAVGAAVTESDLGFHTAGEHGSKAFCVLYGALIVGIGDGKLREAIQLCLDGIGHNRVVAAHVQRGRAGEKVNVFISVNIRDDCATGFFYNQWEIGQPGAGSDDGLVACDDGGAFPSIHKKPP